MEIAINRRGKDRFATEILAKYFFKNLSMRYEDCTIVNLSRTGAAIEFPAHQELHQGEQVFIELIVPRSFEQITVKGTLRRIQPSEHIGGIRFEELLDERIFELLLSLK